MNRIILCVTLLFSCSLFSKDIILAENGKAAAGIVIPSDARPVVRFAANELKSHLDMMTGASFEISQKASLPVNFYLGFGNAEHLERDCFVISAKEDRIDIFGKDTERPVDLFDLYYDNPDKGTLAGVYFFLDSLGIRWPVPGKENAFIPQKKNVKISEYELEFTPSFAERRITAGWDFLKVYSDAKEYVDKVDDFYIWGLRNHVSVRGIIDGCHTEHALNFHKNEERLKHPSQFQTKKDGTQDKNYSCWTDPGTAELWKKAVDAYFGGVHPHKAGFNVPAYLRSQWPCPFTNPNEFMIDPMDHYTGNDGRCYCARCEVFRKKYPCEDDSEIIWKVIAEVASFAEQKYPGKIISTLIYPPKKQLPKYTKIPGNVRVRLCIRGARYTDMPARGKHEENHLKTWHDAMKGLRIPLWTYQCAIFGRALPGVPDTYPHLHASFLKKIKDLSSGMYLEQHAQSYLFQAVDTYIFLRLSWNQDLDVDEELNAYYQMMFGEAAAPWAKVFFNRLETNWNRVDKLITEDVANDSSLGLAGEDKIENQKKVWRGVYTPDEIEALEVVQKKIAENCRQNPLHAKHAEMVRKHVIDIIKAERSELMDKEEKRAKLKLVAAKDIEHAPVYTMLPADRSKKALDANARFQLTYNDEFFTIHAIMDEPFIENSKTSPTRKDGEIDIWTDNCVELFFFSVKSGKYWHVMVNDNGNCNSGTKGRVLNKWIPMPGLKVRTRRLEKSWEAVVEVPISELRIDGGELRFNFCRERHVAGAPEEYSTWSPLAYLGNWQLPDNYATVTFEEK